MWDAEPFPTTITVRPWIDARMDQLGHDPRSRYVEEYWLGVLGPTATWLLRRMAERLEESPAGFQLDIPAVAIELGVGGQVGRNSPCVRSLRRCARFGLAQPRDETTLLVRRRVPSLSHKQVERLPVHLRASHAEAAVIGPALGSTQLRPSGVHEHRERARGIALSLLERGVACDGVERELHRHGVHPALAHEVARWVTGRSTDGSEAEGARQPHPPTAA